MVYLNSGLKYQIKKDFRCSNGLRLRHQVQLKCRNRQTESEVSHNSSNVIVFEKHFQWYSIVQVF